MGRLPVGLRWEPVVGPETAALLEHLGLPRGARDQLLQQAVRILGRCAPPRGRPARETGLVIGYVQSGKTMSFTTVAALARDNGYRLVVVCTGVNVPLFEQSRDRLMRDLRIDQRDDRQWLFLPNPRPNAHTRQSITTALDTETLPGVPSRTVLVAVMKNGTHLDNLSQLLASLHLEELPALVIDDEADQASLNNRVRQGLETATYRRLVGIRSQLPRMTFLQYTATPQALLLINLIDVLSPQFAEVLTPGNSYTGGDIFFNDERQLVRTIPSADIPSATNTLGGPPDSLLEAMRIFFLGVAAWLRDGSRGNRSMMVHPSQRTIPHGNYVAWVRQIRTGWLQTLAQSTDDPDYLDLVDDFRSAYADLSQTVAALASFADLLPFLRGAIRETVVTEMNASGGRIPRPDWRQTYSNIVVGGEGLNRGFTVQGLTVTYMPRGVGTRQADTIQQRARWFGYKEDYLGFCRVYLAGDIVAAYQAYVEHEELLRAQLRMHQNDGASLRDWRRAFFLEGNLRPTRDSVIDVDLQRGNYSDDWYSPHAAHDPEALETNRPVAARFLASIADTLRPDEGDDRRTPATQHRVAISLSLRQVHSELLTRLRATRLCDAPAFTGLLLQVARYVQVHPDATCVVYQMSTVDRGKRTTDGDDEVPNLFQGANFDRTRSPNEMTYPGDREIHSRNELTVQVHELTVVSNGREIARVPAIAVWVPAVMAKDWVVQP